MESERYRTARALVKKRQLTNRDGDNEMIKGLTMVAQVNHPNDLSLIQRVTDLAQQSYAESDPVKWLGLRVEMIELVWSEVQRYEPKHGPSAS